MPRWCWMLPVIFMSCASRIPYTPARVPIGAEEPFRSEDVWFSEIETLKAVNLKTYLDDQHLQYALLMFGSLGCHTCGERDAYVRDTVQQDPLWGRKDFRVIAVDVDAAERIDQVRRYRAQQRFQAFMLFQDDAGAVLKRYFLARDEAFGVPVAALVTANKIVWRYRHDQHADMADIIQSVRDTLGAEPPPTPTPTPTPTATPTAPSRFRDIPYRNGTLADVMARDRANLLWITYRDEPAPSVCRDGRCNVVTVTARDTDLARYFWPTWRYRFDWRYRPVENPDYTLSLPAPEGPFALLFSPRERLVYGAETTIDTAQIERLAHDPAIEQQTSEGVDFDLYPERFGTIQRAQPLTVVTFFSMECTGCRQEIREWSAGLYRKCQASGRCRPLLIENGLEPDVAAYRERITAELRQDGVWVDVALDPHPYQDYLGRVFDGYVGAAFPAWQGLFGSLVYNQEGRVVLSGPTGDPDFAAKFETLLEEP